MSKWQYRYIDVVRRLILSGRVKSDEIAVRLDVSTVTLARWRAKYPHFDREYYAALEDVQAMAETGAKLWHLPPDVIAAHCAEELRRSNRASLRGNKISAPSRS